MAEDRRYHLTREHTGICTSIPFSKYMMSCLVLRSLATTLVATCIHDLRDGGGLENSRTKMQPCTPPYKADHFLSSLPRLAPPLTLSLYSQFSILNNLFLLLPWRIRSSLFLVAPSSVASNTPEEDPHPVGGALWQDPVRSANIAIGLEVWVLPFDH